MEVNNLELILLERYRKMDLLCNSRRDTYSEFLEKWDWWKNPKNIEFVLGIIGDLLNSKIYYIKIPRYLNETAKWLKYLQKNPKYSDIFGNKTSCYIFDYLCHCDSINFLSLYNDFNQNMGNPDIVSRNIWINIHKDYLPKSTHGFNKNRVVLDYNWRLSHQGNLSKYWSIIRPDMKQLLHASWLNNRKDVGKSCKYEVIITKSLLFELLSHLSPLFQIIGLFLAQTGLRISDGIGCLVSQYNNIQFISSDDDEEGRFYFPDVNTSKRNNPIYFVFISKEIMQLLNEYIPNYSKNGLNFLSEKSKIRNKNQYDNINYLKQEFNKNLQIVFKEIRKSHSEIPDYQKIKPHLLRKFFITQTDNIRKVLGDDYLLYLSGHTPNNPLYIIYNQALRSPIVNLKNFVEFIEPAVNINLYQSLADSMISKQKSMERIFLLQFEYFIKINCKDELFTFIDISEFFQCQMMSITAEEIIKFLTLMINKEKIQKIGSFFSLSSKSYIFDIEKQNVFNFINELNSQKLKSIPFFSLCDLILNNHYVSDDVQLYNFLNIVRNLDIVTQIEDIFYLI